MWDDEDEDEAEEDEEAEDDEEKAEAGDGGAEGTTRGKVAHACPRRLPRQMLSAWNRSDVARADSASVVVAPAAVPAAA